MSFALPTRYDQWYYSIDKNMQRMREEKSIKKKSHISTCPKTNSRFVCKSTIHTWCNAIQYLTTNFCYFHWIIYTDTQWMATPHNMHHNDHQQEKQIHISVHNNNAEFHWQIGKIVGFYSNAKMHHLKPEQKNIYAKIRWFLCFHFFFTLKILFTFS